MYEWLARTHKGKCSERHLVTTRTDFSFQRVDCFHEFNHGTVGNDFGGTERNEFFFCELNENLPSDASTQELDNCGADFVIEVTTCRPLKNCGLVPRIDIGTLRWRTCTLIAK